MFSLVSRSRCARWLPLSLVMCVAIGCQPVREDRSINFQKDGDQVAFQHGNDGVFIADKNGGPPRKIFQPPADTVATSTPLWSPTDKRLLFTTAKKADDKARELHPGGDGDPAGNLHFEAKTLYTCWLREEEKDGKAPEPVALFHAVCDHPGYVAANLAVRWHPDGKHILFVEQISEHELAVFEFDLQTKKSRQVVKQTAEAIVFDWAPDNNHLVCVLGGKNAPRDTDGIWIGKPGADDWWQVPESTVLAQGELPAVLEKLRATRPIWSQDGKRFVFVSSRLKDTMNQAYVNHLYLATPQANSVEQLVEDAQPLRDLRWSPDGQRIGYIAGADEGPLTFVRLGDKSVKTLVPNARHFIGWDEKNASLAYVAADPIPNCDGANEVFLIAPNPRYRDALWLAPADGSSPGEKVFAGMQVTFPQWSPKESQLSLWATFNPSYRSWSSCLLDFLTMAAKLDEKQGQAAPININGMRVRRGDPAVLFNPENGALDWKAIDAHEQFQVGHYYLLKRDYATAWQWYEKANKTAKADDLRESLFFQYYCLTKLHRDAEAKEKLAQFERDFWPQLPATPKDPNEQGQSAADLVRALADPKSPQGALLQDLYIAEVFLSLDAAADGEAYFRDALKNATTDAARLNKAVLLSQFLLLTKQRKEYLEIVNTTLLPLLVSQDAFPAAATGKDDNPLSQLGFFTGRQMAVLPLCDPEFVKCFTPEQTQTLLARLQQLRKDAASDVQRLWLDLMLQAAHQRLGQTMEADAVAKRLADNPENLDPRHGKNAVAVIEEVRQAAAQMEELRKLLQMVQ